jgi:hypothetical protein
MISSGFSGRSGCRLAEITRAHAGSRAQPAATRESSATRSSIAMAGKVPVDQFYRSVGRIHGSREPQRALVRDRSAMRRGRCCWYDGGTVSAGCDPGKCMGRNTLWWELTRCGTCICTDRRRHFFRVRKRRYLRPKSGKRPVLDDAQRRRLQSMYAAKMTLLEEPLGRRLPGLCKRRA